MNTYDTATSPAPITGAARSTLAALIARAEARIAAAQIDDVQVDDDTEAAA